MEVIGCIAGSMQILAYMGEITRFAKDIKDHKGDLAHLFGYLANIQLVCKNIETAYSPVTTLPNDNSCISKTSVHVDEQTPEDNSNLPESLSASRAEDMLNMALNHCGRQLNWVLGELDRLVEHLRQPAADDTARSKLSIRERIKKRLRMGRLAVSFCLKKGDITKMVENCQRANSSLHTVLQMIDIKNNRDMKETLEKNTKKMEKLLTEINRQQADFEYKWLVRELPPKSYPLGPLKNSQASLRLSSSVLSRTKLKLSSGRASVAPLTAQNSEETEIEDHPITETNRIQSKTLMPHEDKIPIRKYQSQILDDAVIEHLEDRESIAILDPEPYVEDSHIELQRGRSSRDTFEESTARLTEQTLLELSTESERLVATEDMERQSGQFDNAPDSAASSITEESSDASYSYYLSDSDGSHVTILGNWEDTNLPESLQLCRSTKARFAKHSTQRVIFASDNERIGSQIVCMNCFQLINHTKQLHQGIECTELVDGGMTGSSRCAINCVLNVTVDSEIAYDSISTSPVIHDYFCVHCFRGTPRGCLLFESSNTWGLEYVCWTCYRGTFTISAHEQDLDISQNIRLAKNTKTKFLCPHCRDYAYVAEDAIFSTVEGDGVGYTCQRCEYCTVLIKYTRWHIVGTLKLMNAEENGREEGRKEERRRRRREREEAQDRQKELGSIEDLLGTMEQREHTRGLWEQEFNISFPGPPMPLKQEVNQQGQQCCSM
ncbi:hypothetical protein BS50DRAFT_646032 [Corynespora cassiicola Philippines]|uniref:Uncharacterized protein n=1 Tax=Corynespora cassiicola Philippines TaxID=1448308 RepID=A0A2T2NJR1_CORCC|nr:hypothetical protein BS50DRAFT_646032 [Corynespora cassiicola Philippines]